MFESGGYRVRYPKSAEELILSKAEGPTPFDEMVAAQEEDPSVMVFGLDKEVVTETQWCSLEGYIKSDTLFLIEKIDTGLICGTFVLARRSSILPSLSGKMMQRFS